MLAYLPVVEAAPPGPTVRLRSPVLAVDRPDRLRRDFSWTLGAGQGFRCGLEERELSRFNLRGEAHEHGKQTGRLRMCDEPHHCRAAVPPKHPSMGDQYYGFCLSSVFLERSSAKSRRNLYPRHRLTIRRIPLIRQDHRREAVRYPRPIRCRVGSVFARHERRMVGEIRDNLRGAKAGYQ